MRPSTGTLLAALVARAAAQITYAPMATRPAVLSERRPIVCQQDSCLEAVDATDFCTCIRQGVEDCSSFLIDTVTVEASTVYSTVVSVYTTSITESLTLTTLLDATATATATALTTSTAGTVTQIQSVPAPVYDDKRSLRPVRKIKKRQSKQIPYYAQAACSDEDAYVRACNCRGVFRGTVSVSPSATTVTVISALYSPTETVSETVSTQTSVTTVTTETATTTSTTAAVATAVGVGPFNIQVLSRNEAVGSINPVGRYAGLRYMLDDQGAFYSYMSLDQPYGSGLPVSYIDPDGYLRPMPGTTVSDDFYWAFDANQSKSMLVLREMTDITMLQLQRIKCGITPSAHVLDCYSDVNPYRRGFVTCADSPYAFFGADQLPITDCTRTNLGVTSP